MPNQIPHIRPCPWRLLGFVRGISAPLYAATAWDGTVFSDAGWINTDYQHDVSGNVKRVIAPPGPNGARIETEYDYNSLGHLLSEKSPDFGENKNVFDKANRLRFSQSQAQRDASPSRFSFVKYDVFDRVTEAGEYLDGGKFNSTYADDLNFPSRGEALTRISGLNFYDRLPLKRNHCLEGGMPSTIIIRDDAPEGSFSEFRTWNAAYNHVRNLVSQVSSYSGEIRFYQVVNTDGEIVRPPFGSRYPRFLFSDGLTRKNYRLKGVVRGSNLHQQLVQSYPFTLNDKNLDGRLAMSVSCNQELAATPLGVQQLSTVYNYDKYGNITEEYEFNGYLRDATRQWQKTSMRYDVSNRLVSKGTFANVFAAQPEVEFRYSYDLANRLSYISMSRDSGSLQRVAAIDYNARGLPKWTYVGPSDYQKTLLIIHGYNIRGWIETINARWQFQTDKYVESLYYTNGAIPQYNGNIGTIAYFHEGDSPKQFDYTYDELNRLKRAQYLVQTGGPVQYSKDWQYNYHPNGAINSVIKEGRLFSYGYNSVNGKQTNRLGGVGFSGTYPRNTNNPNNFTYDGSGKMTSDLSKGMVMRYGSREVPYQFDYEEGADEGSQVMAYSGGVRKSKFRYENGEFQSANHYFASGKEVREIRLGETEVVKEILPFAGYGRMIRQGNGTWNTEYFVRNHIGSTVAMVNDIGNVTYKADYEPFGKIWNEWEPASEEEAITEKFTGKEHDDGLELDYFGARYYDADLGMWISPDAARQYHNPYTYCGNNPIGCVDKDGNFGAAASIQNGQVVPSVDIANMGSTEVIVGQAFALGTAGILTGGLALEYAGAWAFGTAADMAVFYSGGAGAQAAATIFAVVAGKKTIEMTRGGGFLDNLRLFDKSVPVARRVWDVASGFFARNASGAVNTFTKAAKPEGTFSRIEKPILEASKQAGKVTEIIEH